MSGQAIVSINDRQWAVDVASLPWELSQGLGGIAEIPVGSGMLFDTGFEHSIQVTTEPMLFALDIAFLSDELVVTEVYRNVAPGLLVTSESPARYFLEVNAGEMEGISAGDAASVELLPVQSEPTMTDWIAPVATFAGVLFLASLAVDLARGSNTKISNEQTGMPPCEIVRPRHYDLVSWFNSPVPDYSFAIEPETRERKIDEVLRRLKSGVDSIQESTNFREFLLTMSKFHAYSIGNLMLITLQRPDATRVAGYTTWKELGRYVRKGEKGIAILAPCMPPKEAKVVEPEDEEDDKGLVEIRPLHFKVVHVFDISQTEGKELPEVEVPALTGEADEELFEGALSLVRLQGLEVTFESRPYQDPAIKGMYSGKTIWVKPEESRAQQLKTLLHEMAHYFSEGVFRMPRRNAETIAESVAFTVGAHFGFDSGVRSFPYVAIWAQDKKVLEQNLADIRKVSTKIIDALQPKISKVGAIA
ncbi:ArdC-like ssDNA-binding domain-containing protein [Chloroflexota bacterium]